MVRLGILIILIVCIRRGGGFVLRDRTNPSPTEDYNYGQFLDNGAYRHVYNGPMEYSSQRSTGEFTTTRSLPSTSIVDIATEITTVDSDSTEHVTTELYDIAMASPERFTQIPGSDTSSSLHKQTDLGRLSLESTTNAGGEPSSSFTAQSRKTTARPSFLFDTSTTFTNPVTNSLPVISSYGSGSENTVPEHDSKSTENSFEDDLLPPRDITSPFDMPGLDTTNVSSAMTDSTVGTTPVPRIDVYQSTVDDRFTTELDLDTEITTKPTTTLDWETTIASLGGYSSNVETKTSALPSLETTEVSVDSTASMAFVKTYPEKSSTQLTTVLTRETTELTTATTSKPEEITTSPLDRSTTLEDVTTTAADISSFHTSTTKPTTLKPADTTLLSRMTTTASRRETTTSNRVPTSRPTTDSFSSSSSTLEDRDFRLPGSYFDFMLKIKTMNRARVDHHPKVMFNQIKQPDKFNQIRRKYFRNTFRPKPRN